MPYTCYQDDDAEAVLLVTNLAEGDTLGICQDHLAPWAQAFLSTITGIQWVPEGSLTDPDTGDATDEDEAADAAPVAPTPEQAPAEEPGGDQADDGDELAEEEHDQMAEDQAVRDADLREELAGRTGV